MQLELADNYLSEQNALNVATFETLPVLDASTGEIYAINMEAFLLLDPVEQMEVVNAAPFLIQKIVDQSGGMDSGLFYRIRTGVSNFVQKAANIINPNVTPAGIPKTGTPTKPPLMPEQMPQTTQFPAIDPKFQLSIEPDPKPWFARTEVLLPVIGGAALLAFFIFRKK